MVSAGISFFFFFFFDSSLSSRITSVFLIIQGDVFGMMVSCILVGEILDYSIMSSIRKPERFLFFFFFVFAFLFFCKTQLVSWFESSELDGQGLRTLIWF